MLSDRRQKVLAALIQEYVARALPVGSRTLTERYSLGVSPATVRNELSILEDSGYITQPHTSAGRIPTDQGYRAFVDKLLESEESFNFSERQRQAMDSLKSRASELDTLLEETSAALARLTNCLSIVLAPSIEQCAVKSLSLVPLTSRKVLIVIVTEDGQVLNRAMDFSEDVNPDDVRRIQATLSDIFIDSPLHEIEQKLSHNILQSISDPLLQYALNETLLCLEENDTNHAHSLGITSLLRQPEFSHAPALVPVMQILENDAILLELLQNTTAQSRGSINVTIGKENKSEELSGISVVAQSYGSDKSAGIIAVIGPTRMDYAHVIKAVTLAKDMLDSM